MKTAGDHRGGEAGLPFALALERGEAVARAACTLGLVGRYPQSRGATSPHLT
jgi:hypothetical protein